LQEYQYEENAKTHDLISY